MRNAGMVNIDHFVLSTDTVRRFGYAGSFNLRLVEFGAECKETIGRK